MRLTLVLLVTYLAAVATTTFAGDLCVRNVMPHLLAAIAVGWVVTGNSRYDALVAAAMGLFSDGISAGRIGIDMAGLLLVGWILQQTRGRWSDHAPVRALLAGLAAGWLTLLGAAVAQLAGDAAFTLVEVVNETGIAAVYTAGVALPAFMIVGWLPPGERQAAPLSS